LEAIGPDETRLVIGADDLSWLARYLVSFPWDFVVEEPKELAQELRRLGRALAAAHS
jgi:predicted DNA-binding transcriptional regulator YafY